jgi:cytochrome c553
MKTAVAILGMFVLAVAVIAAQPAADAAKGKELFTKKCQMCHGADGAGTPAMLKKYEGKLKPLGGADIQAKKDADLAKGFKAAEPHKAVAAGVTDADMADAMAHIRTLKK